MGTPCNTEGKKICGVSRKIAAGPIWLDLVKQALENCPVRDFRVPKERIEFAEIDAETCLLAIPESKKTILECFKEGTVPTRSTNKPGSITETADFFKSGM